MSKNVSDQAAELEAKLGDRRRGPRRSYRGRVWCCDVPHDPDACPCAMCSGAGVTVAQRIDMVTRAVGRPLTKGEVNRLVVGPVEVDVVIIPASYPEPEARRWCGGYVLVRVEGVNARVRHTSGPFEGAEALYPVSQVRAVAR